MTSSQLIAALKQRLGKLHEVSEYGAVTISVYGNRSGSAILCAHVSTGAGEMTYGKYGDIDQALSDHVASISSNSVAKRRIQALRRDAQRLLAAANRIEGQISPAGGGPRSKGTRARQAAPAGGTQAERIGISGPTP